MIKIKRTVVQESSWEEIDFLCELGAAGSCVSVGDVIPIELQTKEVVNLVVAGINVYSEGDVIFTFQDLMEHKCCMNNDPEGCTNEGGYDFSDLARLLDNEVFCALPEDLQRAIKVRHGHRVWLHSIKEVLGWDGNFAFPDDDVQLPYYKDSANRIKDSSKGNWWWLSSPYLRNATDFCCVDHNGKARPYVANRECGIVAGFMI
jgi:hypothetical protein